MHIAIAGNIGSGKTTLTELLSRHYGWEPHFEDVDENPYLDDFYAEMQRWSFNLQIYFLNSRFRQVVDIRRNNRNVVQDRTIYEDAFIFAPNLHAMGLMTSRDFNNYSALFELMDGFIQAPDLLIYLYLDVEQLQKNILKRGRSYENEISSDYLEQIQSRYLSFLKTLPDQKILLIDMQGVDFVTDQSKFQQIVSLLNQSYPSGITPIALL